MCMHVIDSFALLVDLIALIPEQMIGHESLGGEDSVMIVSVQQIDSCLQPDIIEVGSPVLAAISSLGITARQFTLPRCLEGFTALLLQYDIDRCTANIKLGRGTVHDLHILQA